MDKLSKVYKNILYEFALDSIINKLTPNDRVIMSDEEVINFTDTNQEKSPSDKPNGLWYAIGNEWVNWVRGNNSEWESDNLHKIEIGEGILILDTENKIEDFSHTYGLTFSEYYNTSIIHDSIDYIKWGDVSKIYNGIEIIKPRSYSNYYRWLPSWDISSGCVWNKNGVNSIKLIGNSTNSSNKKKYIGQCDTLRRKCDENEKYWQNMMNKKKSVYLREFLNKVDMSALLDDDETTVQYFKDIRKQDPETIIYKSYWGNEECYFIQTSGFEFIFV